MAALKVMDDTYPLCNAGKKRVRSLCSIPRKNLDGELPCWAQLKEFNLDLASRHHLSQPWATSVFTDMAGHDDCLGDEPFSVFLHFTLATAETPIYALSSQNHRIIELCQILPSDSDFVTSKQ